MSKSHPERGRAYYQDQYARYEGKPEAIKERAARNKARKIMTKAVGKAALAGKDVDHIKMIKDGGKTVRSNLRVTTVAKNRGRTR